MRISDWSSDVCSSDLFALARLQLRQAEDMRDIGVAAPVDADEGGGDALRQEGQNQPRGWIGRRQRIVYMGVRIDEAGADDQSRGVAAPGRAAWGLRAAQGEASSPTRDVAGEGA